jgi:hypothetical protein
MYKIVLVGSLPFIVYTFYPLWKKSFYYQKTSSSNYKVKCLQNRRPICPMSSYQQCTNNTLQRPKCNCLENSHEMCPKHKFIPTIYNKVSNLPSWDKSIDLLGNNRVNMYNPETNKFNHLK